MNGNEPANSTRPEFVPQYQTLTEAAAWLSKNTAEEWTVSKLLGFSVEHFVSLHAAPPIDARAAELELLPGGKTLTLKGRKIGEMTVKWPGQWRMAVVPPYRLAQVWLAGETFVVSAKKTPTDAEDAELNFHDENGDLTGVRVTSETIRVSRADLLKLTGHIERTRGVRSKSATPPAPASEPAPAVERSWRIAWPYMVQMLRDGRFSTAKELGRALTADAGAPSSPFKPGDGAHRGKLVVKANGATLALKTIQNQWGELQAAARD